MSRGARSRSRLRPLHALTVLVIAVVAVIVAYYALGWLAGVVWGLVKTVVVIAVILVAIYLVVRWAARSGR